MIFIRTHSQETYVEVTNYYADVMDKVYHHLLKIYVKETSKLVDERITKNDLTVIFNS